MASDKEFVDYVVDQMSSLSDIRCRKMFGDYAVYCGEKVVALVSDNQLFVKPTEKGRTFIGQVMEGPPYPGAKPWFLVEEQVDDRDWLGDLIRITAESLPAPKPKRKPTKAVKK